MPNKSVIKLLTHYNRVVENKRAAKYLVCKKITDNRDIFGGASDKWDYHSRVSSRFGDEYIRINAEADWRSTLPRKDTINFLEIKRELVKKMLEKCELCWHRCGINRISGERGFCGVDAAPRVSTYFLHVGEEPPLIPSGTVFFSGCTFRCAYSVYLVGICA